MSKPVATFVFDRGETIAIALEISTGDPSLVTDVVAKLQFVPWGQEDPSPGQAPAALFTAAAYPAVGNSPAGYTLTIAAGVSATLEPGLYHTDARLVVAGGVIITDRVAIEVRSTISG